MRYRYTDMHRTNWPGHPQPPVCGLCGHVRAGKLTEDGTVVLFCGTCDRR